MDDISGPIEPAPPRPQRNFEAAYVSGAAALPWDIGRPQPAFEQLAERGLLVGRVLDVGCGTGEHAMMAARLGHSATGVDSSETAVGIARRKAAERELDARFVVADALELEDLGETFDTVLDCGLFHVFDDPERARFVDALRAATPEGAWYYMLCFSDRQPGDWGPRRIRQDEIRGSFTGAWHISDISSAELEIAMDPGRVSAWFASIQRI